MWTRPLRLLLTALMVALLAGVSGILIALDYGRARSAAIADATARMKVFSNRLGDRFGILFGDTLSLTNLVSTSDIFLGLPRHAEAERIDFLRRGIAESPHIAAAYVGYPDGGLVQVINLRSAAGWQRAFDPPASAALAFRSARGGERDAKVSAWTFLDAKGRTLRVSPRITESHDPRSRPWYRAAFGKPLPISTQPYKLATAEALAVTVAQSHHGDSRVVVGADVLLDSIGTFLTDERVSPGAVSLLLDPSGKLIIRSNADRASDPAVEIAEAVRPQETSRFVDAGGRTYIAVSSVVELGPLLQGDRIVVAAPLDELTAAARRGMRMALGVALLIVAAGVGSALAMANWISRALEALALEVDRMHRFDFDPPIKLRSHVAEISALEHSMERARDTIRTFGLYVPREIVPRILGAGQFKERSAQRQDITAMFSDIYDFTTLNERHSPENVVEMLSAYFDIFSQIVKEHDGAIIQFLGDSVFAMWNAPIDDPLHVVHACDCALALRTKLDDFNAARRGRAQPELRTRFGIHTGPAVVGSVGSWERLQYTGIGDTLNVASRLEGLNKAHGTEILVSGAVVEQCRQSFVFRPLGPAQAKGRAAELEICELVDRSPHPQVRLSGGGKSLRPPRRRRGAGYSMSHPATASQLLHPERGPPP